MAMLIMMKATTVEEDLEMSNEKSHWMKLRSPLCALALLAVLVTPAMAAETSSTGPAPGDIPSHVVKILRTTNKAQTNKYVPKVYDIENANPYEVFRWVRRTAQIEEGAYYFFAKTLPDGTVKGGKVMVTLPDYMLPGVDEMMKTVDRQNITSSSGEEYVYVFPKHRSVTDAGFVGLIGTVIGNSGSYGADVEVNHCWVLAAPSKIESVKAWLPKFDVPPPQVVVEVAVYEIYVDNEAKIGLDYVNWKNGPGRNLFAFQAYGEREQVLSQDVAPPLLNTGTGGTYGLPGHGMSSSGANAAWFLDVPSAFFDFLVVKNKARIMTSAKIATRDLISATISSGDTILYYKAQVSSAGSGGAPNAGTRPANLPLDPNGTTDNSTAKYSYPDNRTVVSTSMPRALAGNTGVSLNVTPTIGTQGMTLAVVASVVSHNGFDSDGTPVLVTRKTDTNVFARDGQEIILGGMSRELTLERSDKVPFLGSLPGIGYMFGGEGNTTERRQVVVVMTPHIVKDFSNMDFSDSKIDAAMIKQRATGKAKVEVPKTEVGFDQWLLDSEQ